VLGYEPAGQSLVEHQRRLHDVITCSNGRELWFDVTELLVRPQPRRRSRRRVLSKSRRPALTRLQR
jgi:hypothetical protein